VLPPILLNTITGVRYSVRWHFESGESQIRCEGNSISGENGYWLN